MTCFIMCEYPNLARLVLAKITRKSALKIISVTFDPVVPATHPSLRSSLDNVQALRPKQHTTDPLPINFNPDSPARTNAILTLHVRVDIHQYKRISTVCLNEALRQMLFIHCCKNNLLLTTTANQFLAKRKGRTLSNHERCQPHISWSRFKFWPSVQRC